MMKPNLRVAVTAIAAAMVVAAAPSFAADPGAPGAPVGTITISAHAAAAGVGYTWGDGVLVFQGKEHHFSVKGVSVADIGYASIIGHGRVYDLKHLQDFSGTYAAATGEATLGKGIGGEFLRNANGVEIRVDETTKGARLTGAADGIELTLR